MLDEFEEDPKGFELTPMEYVLAALANAQSEGMTLDEVVSAASEAETAEQFDSFIGAAAKAKHHLNYMVTSNNATIR